MIEEVGEEYFELLAFAMRRQNQQGDDFSSIVEQDKLVEHLWKHMDACKRRCYAGGETGDNGDDEGLHVDVWLVGGR